MAYLTHKLPKQPPVSSMQNLQKGDILNLHNNNICIFVSFTMLKYQYESTTNSIQASKMYYMPNEIKDMRLQYNSEPRRVIFSNSKPGLSLNFFLL